MFCIRKWCACACICVWIWLFFFLLSCCIFHINFLLLVMYACNRNGTLVAFAYMDIMLFFMQRGEWDNSTVQYIINTDKCMCCTYLCMCIVYCMSIFCVVFIGLFTVVYFGWFASKQLCALAGLSTVLLLYNLLVFFLFGGFANEHSIRNLRKKTTPNQKIITITQNKARGEK